MVRAWLILLAAFVFAAPAFAASGNSIELSDWLPSASPFVKSQSLNGLAITSSADINGQNGARANVTWSCDRDGTSLAVGITNSDLDFSTKTNSFPFKTKIDSGAVTTINVTPDTTRRFVVEKHLDPRLLFAGNIMNIYKTTYLFIGFPANGDDVVMRINFHESNVSRFLAGCLAALQGHTPAIMPKPQQDADASTTTAAAPAVAALTPAEAAIVSPAASATPAAPAPAQAPAAPAATPAAAPAPDVKPLEKEEVADATVVPTPKPTPPPAKVAPKPEVKTEVLSIATHPNLPPQYVVVETKVLSDVKAKRIEPLAQPIIIQGKEGAPDILVPPSMPVQPASSVVTPVDAQPLPPVVNAASNAVDANAAAPQAQPQPQPQAVPAPQMAVAGSQGPDQTETDAVNDENYESRQGIKRMSERWRQLAKYNLSGGEEMALRKEYSAASARIRIGPMFKSIPGTRADRVRYKIGDVTMGGDNISAADATLTVIEAHKDRDGLDDWYFVKVNCANCSYDSISSPAGGGWIAASDLTAWRDDPLCIKGTKGCN